MKRSVIRYGLVMFLGLLGFFLIMHVLNLSQHYNLRIFNGVIHLGIIWLAIHRYRKIEPVEFNNYMGGVAVGVLTSAVGITLFCLFQVVYLAINKSFMSQLQENVPYIGEYLTPFTAAWTIFVEGLAVSVIGSYIITRIVDAVKTDVSRPDTNSSSNSNADVNVRAGITAARASSNAERASLN